MKIDTLVKQRFEELEQKAAGISNSIFCYQGEEDGHYFTMDSSSFKAWATNVLNLLQRIFGEDSIHYQHFKTHYERFRKWQSEFEDCRAIFQAAREDYEDGYLFNVRGLIKAEDSASALEQATDLLNSGYKDPACIVAGVGLEIAIKELRTRSDISQAKLDAMNIELCKNAIYNMGMQKQITTWAHWRNKAAHGEWNEYTNADVEDMIRGITRFVAEYL